eukprot:408142-Pyramimonas_sp.AAC.1
MFRAALALPAAFESGGFTLRSPAPPSCQTGRQDREHANRQTSQASEQGRHEKGGGRDGGEGET